MLFSLEEQFGDNVTPIEDFSLLPLSLPSSPSSSSSTAVTQKSLPPPNVNPGVESGADGADDREKEETKEEMIEAARRRLEKMGLTVPGVEIRVDEHVARVWFEGLDVECKLDSLRMRVKTVVERAVEGVAPLVDLGGWGV